MRRVMAAVMAGAGLLALPACGGGKTDETARAAGLVPPDTVAFLSVNLSPSVEQKRNLLSIVRKFPDARKEVQGDFTDARDKLLSEIVKEAGLDFKADVEPWLGKELAVAVLPFKPASAEAPPFVVLVESADDGKAKASFEKSKAAGKFEGQYRLIEGYVAVTDMADAAQETAVLDRVAKKAGKGLAGSAGFNDVVDKLHGDRLLLAWADGASLSKSLTDGGDFPGGLGAIFGDDIGAGTVAVDLHAESSALVIDGYATAKGAAAGGKPGLTVSLPPGTLGALTLFNVSGAVQKGLQFVTGLAGSGAVSDFEREAGFSIENDVLSWMRGELAVVAGAAPAGQPFPDFGVVIEPSDRAKAEAGLANIVAALEKNGFTLDERAMAGGRAYVVPEAFSEGIQPAMGLFADRFVLANRPEYLETLATGAKPGFGESDTYKKVVGSGSSDETSFQLIVRIDPIREAFERSFGSDPGYQRDTKPNVEPLDTFGMFSRREGSVHHFTAKMTFD